MLAFHLLKVSMALFGKGDLIKNIVGIGFALKEGWVSNAGSEDLNSTCSDFLDDSSRESY